MVGTETDLTGDLRGVKSLKLIVDIRYFESETINSTGKHLGNLYIVKRKETDNPVFVTTITTRFVLKLREIGLCLPDFDHIFISLTPSIDENEVIKSDEINPYAKWLRSFYIGASPDFFNSLNEDKKIFFLIDKAVDVIQKYYCDSDERKEEVRKCAETILKNGENERIIFKEKKSDTHTVQIIVRVLDFNTFKVYVRIMCNEEFVKEVEYPKNLDRFELPFQFGSINIGKKAVLIKPRKNSLSQMYSHLEDLRYDL